MAGQGHSCPECVAVLMNNESMGNTVLVESLAFTGGGGGGGPSEAMAST